MAFSPNAETVYADGPFGSPLQPSKPEIRSLLAQYEAAIEAYSSGAGSIAKSTRALLFADLAHAADVTAWVYADSTVAYNGIYRKSGASGAGSWSLILPLPFSFIIASDAGAGTANAIQAATSIPVSGSALVWMNIFEANTASPVTVSFNGGTALTVKTNSGNDVAVGGLTAGMIVMGIVSGSTFRLVSDQASSAVLAACEAAQAAAEAAAAAAGVSMASLGGDPLGTTDCTAILDAAEAIYNHIIVGPGVYLVDSNRTWSDTVTYEFRGGRFVTGTGKIQTFNSAIKAGPRDNIFGGHLVQSGFISGVTPPYVFGWQGSPKGDPSTPYWFGAAGDGVANDADEIDCWLYFGRRMYLPPGTFLTNRDHNLKRSNVHVFGLGTVKGTAGTSAALALSGVGVGIQTNIVLEGIEIDAGNVADYNGFGLSNVRDCLVRGIRLKNCGHYAFSLQYECYNNTVQDIFIAGAATAVGSTRAVFSLEGTDGVFTDVSGNVVRNVHASSSGANGVTVIHVKAENTIENVLVDNITGDAAAGLGVLLRLREEVEKCVFKNIRARTITGFVLAADAEAGNNVIEDVSADVVTGAPGSSFGKLLNLLGNDNTLRHVRGYSSDADAADVATIAGARNKLFDCYFKGDTTGAILRVSGTDNEFYGQETVGLAATTRVGNIDGARNKFLGGRTDRSNGVQGLRFNGTDCSCDGMTVTGDGAGGLRVEAAALRPVVVNNHLTGAAATIDKFFASASTGVVCNNRGDTSATNNFMMFGPYSLWVDATGDVRINNGAPVTDTSGTVVGTQT